MLEGMWIMCVDAPDALHSLPMRSKGVNEGKFANKRFIFYGSVATCLREVSLGNT